MEIIVGFFIASSGLLLARLANGSVRRASPWERRALGAVPVRRSMH